MANNITADVSLNIKEIIDYYKLKNFSEFAKIIGISDDLLSKWRKRNSYDIDRIVYRFPDISTTWLLTGKGDMLISEENLTPTIATSHDVGRPYYDVDFTCSFGDFSDFGTNHPAYNINFQPFNKDGVTWVNATGHSMHPEVSSGDIIAIQKYENWRTYLPLGEMYGIITIHGMRTIKRIFKGASAETYRLVPSNKEYDEEEIDKDIILDIYRVLGAFKAF